jgi:SAM-dependent methyltransferase
VTDPYTVDWSDAATRLAASASDEHGWYAAMAAGLVRDGDRTALDVGCGGAGMTAALAALLPAGGLVVAADHEPAVLAAARERLAAEPTRARVELVVVDLDRGVDDLRVAAGGPVDLVWASAALHHAGDQQAAVDALAGLLGPGGRLALAEGGLHPRYLPWDVGVGEPGLEVRLEVAQDRWFARMRERLPGSRRMPYGWTEALRRAGLSGVTTRTTLLERPAPLGPADRERVLGRLSHRVGWLRDTDLLEPADLAAWDRLLDPGSGAWLGHRGDLQAVEARSVHVGIAG